MTILGGHKTQVNFVPKFLIMWLMFWLYVLMLQLLQQSLTLLVIKQVL